MYIIIGHYIITTVLRFAAVVPAQRARVDLDLGKPPQQPSFCSSDL